MCISIPCSWVNGVRFKVLDQITISCLVEDGSSHLPLCQDLQRILLSQEPVSHHPASIHGWQEAPGTSCSLWPEWFQQTVTHYDSKQWLTFPVKSGFYSFPSFLKIYIPDSDPCCNPCSIEIGEVKDADIRDPWRRTSWYHGPLCMRKFLGFIFSGKLSCFDGILHQLFFVNIGWMKDSEMFW